MSIVNNWKVYDLKESLKAAGYPMRIDEIDYSKGINESDLNRAKNLVKACDKDNSAHGQFLSGIIVSFDLTLTCKAWAEAERYKFLTFVSSQSTMHRITKFDLDTQYCEYVDKRIVGIMKELVAKYNETEDKEDYLKILYSNPCGFKLTARMTTNYRCLRNIYQQRKNHRLPEWREFCEWIERLPYANLLIVKEGKE